MSSANHDTTSALPATDPVASGDSGTRYSKRNRTQVCYTEQVSDDDVLDEEEAFEPQSKRRKTSQHKKSKPLPKHKAFPFMDLPAELRNKIYDLALIGSQDPSEPIFVTSKTKSRRRVAARTTDHTCLPQFKQQYSWRYFYPNRSESKSNNASEETKFAPKLLAVSKTIHAEAAAILYSRPMVVADNNALLVFLAQIGRRHSALLRDITIVNWCHSRSFKNINHSAMVLLALTTDLERLNIEGLTGYLFPRRSSLICRRFEIHVARDVYRDCYPWLEAVGRSKGDRFAGIGILHLSSDPEYLAILQLLKHGEDGGEDDEEKPLGVYRKELRRLLSS
ncbi:hypothetical protein HYFRA_00011725 [Hymenoscyphus fraxineus]|uniref:F-box domain-containing protein n=1 Tax=Hymenoscyphus fraxineus TaxID=746836 RepID=A0A9N9PWY2_9HELO|nr:hypothetical protein HYFRA_00011725 [Hymenoscyphus fraxineus]